MKKLIAPQVFKSGAIILTALFFVVGGSYSAWTSQVKLTGNTFETGTIEINITPANALFNLSNMAPGVWSEKGLLVENSGTLDYDYEISAEATDTSEAGVKLFNSLWMEIQEENGDLIDEGWLKDLATPKRLLEMGESENIKIKIKLEDNTDDSYQDLATSFNLVFDAAQSLSGEEGDSKTVVINEIAWMGTKASGTDEWIELYNGSNSDVDLTGWKIKEISDNGKEYSLSGFIASKGYYLIEKNEETTNVPADLIISSLSLLNDGEQLALVNDDEEDVDIANINGGWLAGDDKDPRPTMERKSWSQDGTQMENWSDNNGITKNGLDSGVNEIYGTPKAKNSASN